MNCSKLVTSSDSTSNSSSLAISVISAVPSSTDVLNPSKLSKWVEIYFFRAPVNVDNLTSSYESQIFLMISRLVNPFQKVFNLVCLDPLEESLSAATMYVCLSHVWLCSPMDCSPPGSSVHGISQARILEWGTISSSRGSSWPRNPIHISCSSGWFFTTQTLGKPMTTIVLQNIFLK